MGREEPVALSPAEAKARLRVSATRISPAGWVREHPYETVGLAVAGGFVFGGAPRLRRLIGRGLWSALRRLL